MRNTEEIIRMFSILISIPSSCAHQVVRLSRAPFLESVLTLKCASAINDTGADRR